MLLPILLATLAGGLLSVLLAAAMTLGWLARFAERLLAFSVGMLLTLAFTGLLPESMYLGLDPREAGFTLLAALLGFFMLEKAALWRHDHAHGHPGASAAASSRVAMIVVGDGLHNFVDGVLIAAAFLTDPVLGWTTAIAVLAHEIPQEMSDFVLLLGSGVSRSRALLLNAASGVATMVGGLVGFLTLQRAQALVPYALVVSAASFVYIAIADLVPELHRHRQPRDWARQGSLLLLGMAAVLGIGALLPHQH